MPQPFDPGNRLIVPLDLPSRAAADALVARLAGAVTWLKIGLELYIAEGPAVVRDYVAAGYRVMLDLKLHDIPATVERATARAAALGAGLLTVHAGGGRAMLEAAVRGARTGAGGDPNPDADAGSNPGQGGLRIAAVTVLTSLDQGDLDEVGIAENLADLALRRTRLAVATGCHGVVASPHEAARLRAEVPDDFLLITPGVRPAGSDAGDQKRVTTPRAARAAGADLVVCGRPIRDAADPAATARAIARELAGA